MVEATIVMVCGLSIFCEATIAYTCMKFGEKVHMVFIYVYESLSLSIALNKSVEKQTKQ